MQNPQVPNPHGALLVDSGRNLEIPSRWRDVEFRRAAGSGAAAPPPPLIRAITQTVGTGE